MLSIFIANVKLMIAILVYSLFLFELRQSLRFNVIHSFGN